MDRNLNSPITLLTIIPVGLPKYLLVFLFALKCLKPSYHLYKCMLNTAKFEKGKSQS